VLTLCACTPPLEEVLKLWDFLFAFGVHLAVLCFIGQCLLIRDDLLRSSQYVMKAWHVFKRGAADAGAAERVRCSARRPMKLLQKLPPLQAQPVISLCVRLVGIIPRELYDRLARHPWDYRLYNTSTTR